MEKNNNEILEAWINGDLFITVDDMPPIPKVEKEDYDKVIIPNIIRRGGIPKSFLVVGEEYWGSCRNSDIARWTGEKFVYQRFKFGVSYEDEVNHFQDDDGYDLFVPIRIKRNLGVMVSWSPEIVKELERVNYWSAEVDNSTGSLVLGLREDMIVIIEKPRDNSDKIMFTFYNRRGLALGGGNLKVPDAVDFICKQKEIQKPSKSYT